MTRDELIVEILWRLNLRTSPFGNLDEIREYNEVDGLIQKLKDLEASKAAE